jgi:hypothetical protein
MISAAAIGGNLDTASVLSTGSLSKAAVPTSVVETDIIVGASFSNTSFQPQNQTTLAMAISSEKEVTRIWSDSSYSHTYAISTNSEGITSIRGASSQAGFEQVSTLTFTEPPQSIEVSPNGEEILVVVPGGVYVYRAQQGEFKAIFAQPVQGEVRASYNSQEGITIVPKALSNSDKGSLVIAA